MKRAIALFIALLMTFSVVLAEDVSTDGNDSVEEVTDAEIEEIIEDANEDSGITPDSMWYFVDTVVEDIQLALTFDEAAEAELALEIADERLAETTVMIDEGDMDAAAEAQEGHDEAIATAEEAVAGIESDGNEDQAVEALEQVAELEVAIEGHAAKVASVKDAILARMATKKSPEQLAHIQGVFDKIKAKAQQMEEKTATKEEQVKTKYKALSKKTDAEVDENVAAIKEKAGGKSDKQKDTSTNKGSASKGKKA